MVLPRDAVRVASLALRPVSRAARPVPSAAADSPARLGASPALRLLAGRLGRPPSLSQGCAPLQAPAPRPARRPVVDRDPDEARRCVGRALPAPLDQALISEEVGPDQRVRAVLAEESFDTQAAAAARQEALLRDLRPVLPAPAADPSRHLFLLDGHQITLERDAGPAGAWIALELRQVPVEAPRAATVRSRSVVGKSLSQ